MKRITIEYFLCWLGLHDWEKWEQYKHAALQCQYCKHCGFKRTRLT